MNAEDLQERADRVLDAHRDLLTALVGYRDALATRRRTAAAVETPNPKLIAIYEHILDEFDELQRIVDEDVDDGIIRLVNSLFSIKQAESPGGMIKLGARTSESDEEVEALRSQGRPGTN